MTENTLKAVLFSTKTSAELQEDGTWKSLTRTEESRLHNESDEWVSEYIESMCIDDSLQDSVNTSTRANLSFMIDNVYSAGFPGLIEYFEFQRKSKEAKESPVQA